MNNNIIIGTAGHVDHGKTCLIKALTGIDTDRLKEEKKRGITIELGFAYIDLPGGVRAGVIDVPGHEKFIKNMLAGAGGIDLAMLIIAADEGIMPQTQEHLAILQLLNIKKGLIVLTKADTVDTEWVEMMVEEVSKGVKGTFLADSPIIPVSAFTGAGMEELKIELAHLAEQAEHKNEDIPFRVPVDRVFSIDGFGTVITGTLIEGTASEGDSVTIYPKGLQGKIRGIQVHSRSETCAYPGQRVAINLSGVHKSDIERGDIIAAAGSMDTSMMVDVSLKSIGDTKRKIKNGSRLHFYHGSREILCKTVLLECDALEAGNTAYAQLRLEESVSLKTGDRFIVRFYSPLETVGGGVVLDANPKKHKRFDPKALEDIKAKEAGSVQNKIALTIKEHSRDFITVDEIQKQMAINREDFNKKIENLVKYNEIVCVSPKIYVHKDYVSDIEKRCITLLSEHHKSFPLQEGMRREAVASKLLRHIDSNMANGVLEEAVRLGKIENNGGVLCVSGFKPGATSAGEAQLKKLEQMFYDGGLTPDVTETVVARLGVKPAEGKELYSALLKSGKIVRVDAVVTLHKDFYNQAVDCLRELFELSPQVTLGEFRDKLGTSRKYAVAVLEYFDNLGFCKKNGDFRVKGTKLA